MSKKLLLSMVFSTLLAVPAFAQYNTEQALADIDNKKIKLNKRSKKK